MLYLWRSLRILIIVAYCGRQVILSIVVVGISILWIGFVMNHSFIGFSNWHIVESFVLLLSYGLINITLFFTFLWIQRFHRWCVLNLSFLIHGLFRWPGSFELLGCFLVYLDLLLQVCEPIFRAHGLKVVIAWMAEVVKAFIVLFSLLIVSPICRMLSLHFYPIWVKIHLPPIIQAVGRLWLSWVDVALLLHQLLHSFHLFVPGVTASTAAIRVHSHIDWYLIFK